MNLNNRISTLVFDHLNSAVSIKFGIFLGKSLDDGSAESTLLFIEGGKKLLSYLQKHESNEDKEWLDEALLWLEQELGQEYLYHKELLYPSSEVFEIKSIDFTVFIFFINI